MQKKHCQIQEAEKGQGELRRGSRQRTQLKIDYYQMSVGMNEDGDYVDEEDYQPRQNKKRRKRSEDFEGKPTKKKNVNKIVGLLDWRYEVEVPNLPEEGSYEVHSVKDVCKTDFTKLGKNVQAMFVNVKWENDFHPLGNQGVSFQNFAQMNFEENSFMNSGLIFIWTPKHKIPKITQIMEQKNFYYVENLQILLMDLEKGLAALSKVCNVPKEKEKEKDNEEEKERERDEHKSSSKERSPLKKKLKVITTGSEYTPEAQFADKEIFFTNMDKLSHIDPIELLLENPCSFYKQSKLHLTIYRKFGSLELRHQRTPDVICDIVSPKTLLVDAITKNFIYEMIEEMLPNSLSKEQGAPLRLVQLWGNKDVPRAGWITVAEK